MAWCPSRSAGRVTISPAGRNAAQVEDIQQVTQGVLTEGRGDLLRGLVLGASFIQQRLGVRQGQGVTLAGLGAHGAKATLGT